MVPCAPNHGTSNPPLGHDEHQKRGHQTREWKPLDAIVADESPDKSKRRSSKRARARRLHRNLRDASMLGFSSVSRALVMVTVGLWFGALVHSHYQLTRVLVEDGDQEQSESDQYIRRQIQLHSLGVVATKLPIKEVEEEGLAPPALKNNDNHQSTPPPLSDPHQEHTQRPLLRRNLNSQLTTNQTQPMATFTTDELASHRFLVFQSLSGQGAGNLMNGLLALHLLADEFNRTVCVETKFHFLQAFEMTDPYSAALCDAFFHSSLNDPKEIIGMINFQKPLDECQLKEMLASEKPQYQAIYMQANTYVRWRSVPPNYFFRFYKPKTDFLDEFLPYDPSHPPSTVVHLRKEDGQSDIRKGLDQDSLDALGKLLSSHVETEKPFLVTNNVDWFEYFQETYGWRHPDWEQVHHSALRKAWGAKSDIRAVTRSPVGGKRIQRMQLWADWYSILTAKKVYHTHSDFSLSAIHWMGQDPKTNEDLTWSRTILDYDQSTGTLKLTVESWVTEQVMKPLVDREGTELAHCSGGRLESTPAKQKLGGLDITSDTTRNFIQKSLEIDPRLMQEFRQRMKQHHGSQSGPQKRTAEEISETVTKALKKQQKKWENDEQSKTSK